MTTRSISNEKLKFWIDNRYNVLFVGKHGVGKTSIIIDCFNAAGLKWKIMNGSTLDPFVDFVGCPREKITEDGIHYLDFVRPLEFEKDEVEALFIDELNRSHKKVRNAVMELIQFKSINGRPFKNLKIVWAAINPNEEDVYDVEALDPALEDRFHIKVEVPYEPSMIYFKQKYGEDLSRSAISWWRELPKEQKEKVSPRRLDYAIDVFNNGGDVRDVLPHESNCSKLLLTLKIGPIQNVLEKLFKDNDSEKAKAFLAVENNFAASMTWIVGNKERFKFFLPVLSQEKISSLLVREQSIQNHVLNEATKCPVYADILKKIRDTNQNQKLISIINKRMRRDVEFQNLFFQKPKKGELAGESYPVPGHWSGRQMTWTPGILKSLNNRVSSGQTQVRLLSYDEFGRNVPLRMTHQESIESMNYLNTLCSRSHPTTLRTLSNFIGIVNHILKIYADHEKKTPALILQIALQRKLPPNPYYALAMKIVHDPHFQVGVIRS